MTREQMSAENQTEVVINFFTYQLTLATKGHDKIKKNVSSLNSIVDSELKTLLTNVSANGPQLEKMTEYLFRARRAISHPQDLKILNKDIKAELRCSQLKKFFAALLAITSCLCVASSSPAAIAGGIVLLGCSAAFFYSSRERKMVTALSEFTTALKPSPFN